MIWKVSCNQNDFVILWSETSWNISVTWMGDFPSTVAVTYFCGNHYRDKPQVLFCGQKSFNVLSLSPTAPQIMKNYPFPFGFELSPGYVRIISWGCSLHWLLHSYLVLYESSARGAPRSLCIKQGLQSLSWYWQATFSDVWAWKTSSEISKISSVPNLPKSFSYMRVCLSSVT